VFLQFGIVWLFVLHASEINGLVLWCDEVVGMGEGVPLDFLPNLLEELVVDGL
jgi:hypothetical protein